MRRIAMKRGGLSRHDPVPESSGLVELRGIEPLTSAVRLCHLSLKDGTFPPFLDFLSRKICQFFYQIEQFAIPVRQFSHVGSARETCGLKARALMVEVVYGLCMEAMRRGDRKTLKLRTLSDKGDLPPRPQAANRQDDTRPTYRERVLGHRLRPGH
ncbi:hypothetical protein [Sphingomonas sp. MM-1]|uniref:hypothetical protein n=1 Tax=Sphingomonas sp. MM-1 TaxID=745310 RepID=UPI001182EA72|nr:hypothetical protein [Sphingomonas sp. MM-1]